MLSSLVGQTSLTPDSSAYGTAFEHFLFHELSTYLSYQNRPNELTFWRSVTHQEVDFVVGKEVGIEVKATRTVAPSDLKGLLALDEDLSMRRKIIVSREPEKRLLGKVEIYPYRQFLAELWSGQIV